MVTVDTPEYTIVKNIGEAIGYGALMQFASALWAEAAKRKGLDDSEHTVGPCRAMMVECECLHPHECDWCCGTALLTKHVKTVKDLYEID